MSGIYGNPGQTNYGAAKMGIAAFTIIAAQELARYGVTVNAIAPGALHPDDRRASVGSGSRPRSSGRADVGPQWIAPICVWLASPESREVTGRVFEASGRVLAVAESWHRGPTAEPVLDPEAIGPIAMDLVARARPNADMDGQDRTEA